MNCKRIQPLLSEYIDNAVSARDTWEIDRHLADCHECTRALNEMRRTVDLVAGAPRLEVTAEFVDRLATRIAGLQPSPPRRAWVSLLGEMFRPRALPALGLALATCALAVVVFLPHNAHGTSDSEATRLRESAQVKAAANQAANQSVALAASDPFADIAAANLAAHASVEPAAMNEAVPD